jgi:hypothetical protein
MPNDVLQVVGTQVAFYVTGDYSPADPGTDFKVGSPTEAVLTLSGVATGAARQSAKVDLGTTRARAYEVLGAFDFTDETPVATGRVDVYWAPSTSGTAANGNIAGNSGADGAAPDGALGSITLAEFLKLCIFIGSMPTHDGGVVQNGFMGILVPPGRYGQMIVVNNSGDAFEADNVEMGVFMNQIVDQVQD